MHHRRRAGNCLLVIRATAIVQRNVKTPGFATRAIMALSSSTKSKRQRTKLDRLFGAALPLIAMLLLSGVALAQTGGPPKPGETPFFERLDNTWLGSNVRDSNWLFPVIESIHVVGIVFLVGASVLLDLRLLNRGYLRDRPVSEVSRRLLPVMWTAFGVMLATGALMLLSESWQCYTSIAFRVKMALLLAVGANVLFFYFAAQRRMCVWDNDAVAPLSARAVAWVSMILWVGIVFAGRFIAYW
jgi:uncharacterized membrane protein